MKNKEKIKAIVSVLSICTLIIVLALPCFASWQGTVSAADWWNAQASTCSLYAYSANGGQLNTPVPVNLAAFHSRTYDISPYVSWTSVTSKYISSQYATIESTFTPLPDGASMYGLQLQFHDKWSLLKGRTYEFIILRNSIAFYNQNNEPISTGTQVIGVSLGGLAMTIEDVKLSSDLYDRAIRCTVTPSSDTTVQTISVSFKSMYNPSIHTNKVILNVGFSDVVSYTGSLDDVVVNPTLNNIDKQLSEISDKLDQIHGGSSGKFGTDIMPGLHDNDKLIDDIEKGQDALCTTLDEYLKMMKVPDADNFWSSLGGFFFEADTVNAILWWGDRYGECMDFQLVQVLLYFSVTCLVTATIFGVCRWSFMRIRVKDTKAAENESKKDLDSRFKKYSKEHMKH